MRRNRESGFAMLLVFAMAGSVAIMLYMQMPRAAFEAQRDKEQLLMDRGAEYIRGIQLFTHKYRRFPSSMDDLEKFGGVRFLRRRYKDPMTGKDEWRVLQAGPGGVLLNSLVQPNQGADQKEKDNRPQFISDAPAMNAGQNTSAQAGANLALRRRPSDEAAMNGVAGSLPGGGQIQGQFQFNNPQQNIPQQGQVPGYPQQGYPQQAQSQGQQLPPGYPQQQQGQIPAYPQQGQFPPGYPQQGQTGQFPPGVPVPPGYPQGSQIPGQPGQQTPQQQIYPNGVPSFPGAPPVPGQQNQAGGRGMPAGMPSPSGYPPPIGSGYSGNPQQNPFGQQQNASGQQFPGGSGGYPTQPATQDGRPTTAGNNAALKMLGDILTNPRPQPGNMPNAGAPAIGGGIAGVASTLDAPSIKVYNERQKYNEWEFVYDMKKDRRLTGAGTNQGGNMPGQPVGNSIGQPLGGSNSLQPPNSFPPGMNQNQQFPGNQFPGSPSPSGMNPGQFPGGQPGGIPRFPGTGTPPPGYPAPPGRR